MKALSLSSGLAPRRHAWARSLASPRLTLLALAVLAAGAYATGQQWLPATWAAGIPIGLLTLNLVAALAVSARLRTDLPLLLLHLSLLAAILLFALGRLTYFNGFATLSQGASLEDAVIHGAGGPWHRLQPERISFTNYGFTEAYPVQGRYVATYNRVRWHAADGSEREATIGDDQPLVREGYRIYTTTNRGFSPIFVWLDWSGAVQRGVVQLPDMHAGQFSATNPITDGGAASRFAAAQRWTLPDGKTEAWIMLDPEDTPVPQPGDRRQNLAADALAHTVVLRVGTERWLLRPGDAVDLPEGRLVYERLESWMGYRLVYDRTIPWLLGTAAAAVLSLVWYYWRRFHAAPWEKNSGDVDA